MGLFVVVSIYLSKTNGMNVMGSLTKQDGVIYGFTDEKLFAKDSLDYLWIVNYRECFQFIMSIKPTDIEVLESTIFLKCERQDRVFEFCAKTGAYTGNYTN